MTEFTIGTFNLKNLVGPNIEYYRFQRYTDEEYAWKQDWLSDQLLRMDADIVCFQEAFDSETLGALVRDVNDKGRELNDDVIPDRSKRYSRKAIFRKLAFDPYPEDGFRWAPNGFSEPEPGAWRPGVAVLSRFGFARKPDGSEDVTVHQTLENPLDIAFEDRDGHDAGTYTLRQLSRPILRVGIEAAGQRITIFNCHLKSKLGEFVRPKGAPFAPEQNLLDYDPVGRALGELRSLMRRTAEAIWLRTQVVEALAEGHPVFVLGDFNDSEHSVSSAVIAGERPFKNYSWIQRHDAQKATDRYSKDEDAQIRGAISRHRLFSAEKLFVRKSLRDMIYTSAFGGVYESIDQILMSHHFDPDDDSRIGDLDYLSVYNDHLTDGSHPDAPYNKLASDHGQLVAHLRWRPS